MIFPLNLIRLMRKNHRISVSSKVFAIFPSLIFTTNNLKHSLPRPEIQFDNLDSKRHILG